MDIFYAPIQLLVWHPERALLIAAVFIVLMAVGAVINKNKGKAIRQGPIIIATIGWVLFGVNEYFAYIYKWNIRVDLLLIGPVILVASIYALLLFFLDIKKSI